MAVSKTNWVGTMVLTFFLPIDLFGQPTAVVESFSNIAGQPFFPSQYLDVRGTPYLFDDWRSSTIVLSDGKTLTNVKTNFNLVTDDLLYVDEHGKTMIASTKVVKSVEADGRKFIMTPARNSYLEILSTEGKATLMKHHKKVIMETKPFNSATIEKNFRTSESLVLVIDEKITEVKSVNDIYEMLPGGDVLKDFVKKEKLKQRSEDSWVKIVNYYNSI